MATSARYSSRFEIEDREYIAEELMRDAHEPASPELMAEIQRRVENIGKSPGFTLEESMARARAVVDAVRKSKQ